MRGRLRRRIVAPGERRVALLHGQLRRAAHRRLRWRRRWRHRGPQHARRRAQRLAQHRDPAADADRAGHRLRLAEDQPEQTGLAGAVTADEAGALAPEGEGQVFEENAAVRTAKSQAVEGDEHEAPGSEGRTDWRIGSSSGAWSWVL